MKKTIWYICKPGEERDFATTKQPSPYWVKSIKEQGYVIYSFEVSLPDPGVIDCGLLKVLDKGAVVNSTNG